MDVYYLPVYAYISSASLFEIGSFYNTTLLVRNKKMPNQYRGYVRPHVKFE
jgi:hypothetical protein